MEPRTAEDRKRETGKKLLEAPCVSKRPRGALVAGFGKPRVESCGLSPAAGSLHDGLPAFFGLGACNARLRIAGQS